MRRDMMDGLDNSLRKSLNNIKDKLDEIKRHTHNVGCYQGDTRGNVQRGTGLYEKYIDVRDKSGLTAHAELHDLKSEYLYAERNIYKLHKEAHSLRTDADAILSELTEIRRVHCMLSEKIDMELEVTKDSIRAKIKANTEEKKDGDEDAQ